MKKQNDILYLDNSATTQVSPEVLDAMKPYYTSKYYNPDSLYYQAREVRAEVEKVRSLIADTINADPDEIYFTSGGSESNTWAMSAFHDMGVKEILITPIEHHSLTYAAEHYIPQVFYTKLEENNLDPNSHISTGRVDIDELDFLLKRMEIGAASIMTANNEIGTIQSIPLIAGMLEEYNIPLHTDAVQAFMHTPIDVETMGVTMLSASAHKIGGPKGVGFLYIKHGTKVNPLIFGGQQEQGIRGGTTNVPAIIGFGKAVEIAHKNKNKLLTKSKFGDILEKSLLDAHGLDMMFTGSIVHRLPNHISMCFRDISGQQLVSMLAEKGILCSTGSACNSGNPKPSFVLEAINIPEQFIDGALRISYTDKCTDKDAIYVASAIEDCVNILRSQR